MQREIEIARLVHYFVRDRLSDIELNQLFTLLDEDPGLLDYIMVDYMIYEYGLLNKRQGRKKALATQPPMEDINKNTV